MGGGRRLARRHSVRQSATSVGEATTGGALPGGPAVDSETVAGAAAALRGRDPGWSGRPSNGVGGWSTMPGLKAHSVLGFGVGVASRSGAIAGLVMLTDGSDGRRTPVPWLARVACLAFA